MGLSFPQGPCCAVWLAVVLTTLLIDMLQKRTVCLHVLFNPKDETFHLSPTSSTVYNPPFSSLFFSLSHSTPPMFLCWPSWLQPDSDPPSISQELVLQVYATASGNIYFCHLYFGRSVKDLVILCVEIYIDVHFYEWIYVCNSFIVVVVISEPRAENTLGKHLPSSLKEICDCWDRTSLSCPGWPWNYSVAQTELELVVLPASVPGQLGLEVSMPSLLPFNLWFSTGQWNSYSDTWHEKSIQDFCSFCEEIKFFLQVTKSLGRLFIIQKLFSPWLSQDDPWVIPSFTR